MPANLKDLRTRIKSVKSTQQITKAMKLVSAAKFGKAQNSVVNSRPYAKKLASLTAKLAGIMSGGCNHPLMNSSSSKTAVLLAISSERGLCGGYNANVTKQAIKTASDLEKEGFKVAVVCIGKKSFQAFLRRRRLSAHTKMEPAYVTEEAFVNSSAELLGGEGLTLITAAFDKPNNHKAKNVSDSFAELYTQGKIGKLVVVYNKFQSAMVQIPTAETILPLRIDTQAVEAEPIFEPEIDDLLDHVLPRYMVSRIFQTLLEAVASEHGARMSAMDSATRNAQEMERKLKITYQRARQAAITNELIEIISGAEAL
ncbi:MAG: FoF1 ATP synthase subunit gamma [Bdellovibrionota bacterium]